MGTAKNDPRITASSQVGAAGPGAAVATIVATMVNHVWGNQLDLTETEVASGTAALATIFSFAIAWFTSRSPRKKPESPASG
ncbi:MAG: hypothetical protein ACRDJG_03225 [Actinomycetota bacterium]